MDLPLTPLFEVREASNKKDFIESGVGCLLDKKTKPLYDSVNKYLETIYSILDEETRYYICNKTYNSSDKNLVVYHLIGKCESTFAPNKVILKMPSISDVEIILFFDVDIDVDRGVVKLDVDFDNIKNFNNGLNLLEGGNELEHVLCGYIFSLVKSLYHNHIYHTDHDDDDAYCIMRCCDGPQNQFVENTLIQFKRTIRNFFDCVSGYIQKGIRIDSVLKTTYLAQGVFFYAINFIQIFWEDIVKTGRDPEKEIREFEQAIEVIGRMERNLTIRINDRYSRIIRTTAMLALTFAMIGVYYNFFSSESLLIRSIMIFVIVYIIVRLNILNSEADKIPITKRF